MNILVIYAHPQNKNCFNHELSQTVKKSADKNGHMIEIRDLYHLEFNPVLSQKELVEPLASSDVVLEQEFIRQADMLVFIYPLWWGGMPAIMHGYLDRVFSYGFAYTSGSNGSVGLLTDKRVVVINTIGSSLQQYQQNGMIDALEIISNAGIFNFCGTSVEKFFHFAGISSVGGEERAQMLISLQDFFDQLGCATAKET